MFSPAPSLEGVRCERNGSVVYPVNPDIVNGYCSLAGPAANCLYESYTIVTGYRTTIAICMTKILCDFIIH